MNRIPTRQRGITISAPLGSPLGLYTAYHLNWPSVIGHGETASSPGDLDLDLRTLAASVRNTAAASRLDHLTWEPYENESTPWTALAYWHPIWRFADGRRVRFWEVMTEDAPVIRRILSSPELRVEALAAVIL